MDLPSYLKPLLGPKTRVEETHIDYVLIGPKYAYKIKKPVKFSFVDFSTLARRKRFCEEEVNLNRRYSPSLYLGVVPIEENGKIVDYAVKMKALPAKKRLDILLHQNKVTRPMIRTIAKEVWRFHKKAKPVSGQLYNNFNDILPFIGRTINQTTYYKIKSFTDSFLHHNRQLLARRVKKDLHGDLHSNNIFYLDKPYIFDCVEFNPKLRHIDPAAEISFLLMDLEFNKREELAKEFLAAYISESRDYAALKLINFYKCHYACVRGLIASLAKDHRTAKKYFKLAEKYASGRPLLIAIGGMIGTGKSSLAGKLGKKLDLPVLNSDRVRKDLAGRGPRLYTPAFTKKAYSSLLSRGETMLDQKNGVILDATFSPPGVRQKLIALSKRKKADLNFIELTAPPKTLLKRLRQRKKGLSEAGPELLPYFIENYRSPKEFPVIKP
ncbi:MAG: AAA family ATPase [bacterium]